MKANKAKSSKKPAKKVNKRVAKKELEASITEKFMEVISNLGQDAGKFGKDIKKASKQLAKKLADKFQSVKDTVEDKFEGNKMDRTKAVKKPISSPQLPKSKSVAKAEKVVAKVTKANTEVKPKRAYNRRPLSAVPENTSAAGAATKQRVSSKAAIRPVSRKASVTTTKPRVPAPAPVVSSPVVPETPELNAEHQDERNNTI